MKGIGKWLIVIAVIACICIGLWLWLRKRNKQKIEDAMQPDNAKPNEGQKFTPGAGNRPERNNNPFNLKLTNLAWNGKVPKAQNTDGVFEQFFEKRFGVRAGMKNIINKVARGKNTLNTLIPVYAPATENDTTLYIQQVSQWTGWDPSEAIPAEKDAMIKLVAAIAKKEGVVLSNSELVEAYQLI
jgi:hypothetical protein